MILIDYQSKQPFYEQIARRFQTLILKGALNADEQMPSVRSLAVELSINPNTIQKAYTLLEQQGYIYTVKGRGSFVCDTSDLISQRRAALLDEVKEKISVGRELGIGEETWNRIVRKLYHDDHTDSQKAGEPND